MNILYISPAPCFPFKFTSGGVISLYCLMKELKKRNPIISCESICYLNPEFVLNYPFLSHLKKNEISYTLEKNYIKIHADIISEGYIFETRQYFYTCCKKIIHKKKPNIIFIQQKYSFELIRELKEFGIPIFWFINTPTEMNNEYHPSFYEQIAENVTIFCCSKYLHSEISNYYSNSYVLYPFIRKEDFFVENKNYFEQEYITMVNPVEVKGRKILLHLITDLTNYKFQIVEGWPQGIAGINSNKKLFNNYSNVKYVDSSIDMRKIYKITKLLIVPSIINETFGRVVLEAHINQIPVLSSNIGGLKESVGQGGVLVNDYQNLDIWSSDLKRIMSDYVLYNHLSMASSENYEKYISLFYSQFDILLNLLNKQI